MKINNRLLSDDDENAVTAHAQYVGARITASDQPSPVHAATELARKILTGGKCRCGRLVALSDDGATAFGDPVMADGSRWPVEKAASAGQCRWRLIGATWTPSCPTPADRQNESGS